MESREQPKDPRNTNGASESNKKAITALSESLPGLIRTQTSAQVKQDLETVMLELDRLKDYYSGLEKTSIDLLKWKNAGLVCHRDELVGSKWASAVLELTNSDNSASFERLVAVCLWARNAYYSASRQENVKRFLGKSILKSV